MTRKQTKDVQGKTESAPRWIMVQVIDTAMFICAAMCAGSSPVL